MRKKVDERIRTLIENGVKLRHRSLFLIIGDKSREQARLDAPLNSLFSFYSCNCNNFALHWIQIVNLHYMLSKAVVKSRPTVLWCYKDKLELSRFILHFILLYYFFELDIGFNCFMWIYVWCSHKKKRAKQVKKLMQRGLLDPEKVDPFSLFLETGGLTYCLYKDSERILGNTFGMCILQVSKL
jgi:N-acetyltransferase 10